MDENTVNNSLVVYYWTNLALLEQGQGLEQQKTDFQAWQQQQTDQVAAEFTDTFLKRTKPKHFPELANAVNYCLANHTKLIIVKLDGLLGQKEFADLLATPGLQFACIDKNLVTPEVLSVVRQYVEDQSKQHGNSIKRGLRLTTNKLGNPNAAKAISPFNKIKTENAVLFALLLQPIIAKYRQQGLSQRKMVTELNDAGILAPEGGKWVLSQLQKVLKRIDTNEMAMDLGNEIDKQSYSTYSATELVSALNQGEFTTGSTKQWDEDVLKALQTRNTTIDNVVELYGFIQQNGNDISNFISTGCTLAEIADKLNTNNVGVPKTIVDTSIVTTELSPADGHWDGKLVEEIIKRMNNALSLPYDTVVLKDFSQALQEYSSQEGNTKVKEIYSNTALQNLLSESNQAQMNNKTGFNS